MTRDRCAIEQKNSSQLDNICTTNIDCMSLDLRAAISAWRDAVTEARAAEKLLEQNLHSYLDRRGPAVTDGLVKEVAQFRSLANARLTLALSLMKSAAEKQNPK